METKFDKFNRKIKNIECIVCGEKNTVNFMIAKDEEEGIFLNHNKRKIKDDGEVGRKMNLENYELHFCDCIECGGEIGSFDMISTFDDGVVLTGDVEIFEYLKGKDLEEIEKLNKKLKRQKFIVNV